MVPVSIRTGATPVDLRQLASTAGAGGKAVAPSPASPAARPILGRPDAKREKVLLKQRVMNRETGQTAGTSTSTISVTVKRVRAKLKHRGHFEAPPGEAVGRSSPPLHPLRKRRRVSVRLQPASCPWKSVEQKISGPSSTFRLPSTAYLPWMAWKLNTGTELKKLIARFAG